MASKRLSEEVKIGDLPKIDLGNFNWQPVDKVFALSSRAPAAADANRIQKPIAQQFLERPEFEPARPLTKDEFPLNLLEDRTFAGTGYNTIWRPRSDKAIEPRVDGQAGDVLELNLTAESMAFSKSLGDVPNRGVSAQADLTLKGVSYVQRVGAFENPKSGSNDIEKPVGIHFEPGVFMFVPASDVTPPKFPATINRMASIPHGTTINAQGLAPSVNQVKGAPTDIKVENIIPFNIDTGKPFPGPFSQHLNFEGDVQDNRLPTPLTKFKSMSREN